MGKMKIYISGAISGTSDYTERFAEAERDLTERGFIVVNPVKIFSSLPEDTTWEQYMELSMVLLKMCGAICFLEGWKNSKGARLEYDKAVRLGLRKLKQVK